MNKTTSTRTFEQWMDLVDQNVLARLGLSVYDLPDCCYRDWYEAGVSPKGAAGKAIKSAKGEE